MPVHDWTQVEDGIFHAFHTTWLGLIQSSLNSGVLPDGYYALAEQHFGRPIADVLTLHASPADGAPIAAPPPIRGGSALAEAPPRVQRRQVYEPTAASLRRTLSIRHVSGHRLVALLEIMSPANKDREAHVDALAEKIGAALDAGVHVQLVDLLRPGQCDPQGMHGEILTRLGLIDAPYDLPADQPLTLASYAAGPRLEVFVNHVAVGSALPDTPLFLHPDHYVYVPLEETYQAAYRGMPAFWRDVLEGRPRAS